jgi:hypothetical protein
LWWFCLFLFRLDLIRSGPDLALSHGLSHSARLGLQHRPTLDHGPGHSAKRS